MSIGVPYELFWDLNPKTLQPFSDGYRLRMERESEVKSSEIDITAWSFGLYVREAIVSAFNSSAKYPMEPASIRKKRVASMTSKDHANNFREFLKQYKRPPVKGGEK